MPEFEASVEIETYEFIEACSRREKISLVNNVIEECVVDNDMEKALRSSLREHFPGTDIETGEGLSYDHEFFISSLRALASSYYQLSNEVIENINSVANPFRYR